MFVHHTSRLNTDTDLLSVVGRDVQRLLSGRVGVKPGPDGLHRLAQQRSRHAGVDDGHLFTYTHNQPSVRDGVSMKVLKTKQNTHT